VKSLKCFLVFLILKIGLRYGSFYLYLYLQSFILSEPLTTCSLEYVELYKIFLKPLMNFNSYFKNFLLKYLFTFLRVSFKNSFVEIKPFFMEFIVFTFILLVFNSLVKESYTQALH